MDLQKLKYDLKTILSKDLTFKSKLGYLTKKSVLKFSLTPNVRFNMQREAYEPFAHFSRTHPEMVREMKSFLKLTKNRHCLLDIGALYGIFSLGFTNNNKNSIAHAIEPSPTSFNILLNNIKLNTSVDIRAYKLALGSSKGRLRMKYQGRHLVTLANNEKCKYTISVDVDKLDNFIKKHKLSPDCVKIDTEGFEYNILKGGYHYLKKHKPIIFLEVHLPWLQQYGISARQLEALIYSLDYEVYDLNCNLIKVPHSFFVKRTCRVICSNNLS
jgi:FkbM family methyltransferase